jgi:hypothetical protein
LTEGFLASALSLLSTHPRYQRCQDLSANMLAGIQTSKHITGSRLSPNIPLATSTKDRARPTLVKLMPALRRRLLRRLSLRHAPFTAIMRTTPAQCLHPAANHLLIHAALSRLPLLRSPVPLVPSVHRSRKARALTAAPSVNPLAQLQTARKTRCGVQSASAALKAAPTANNTCKRPRRS